jgi:phosphosulfolactate phosphohydrolase-like enzyme
LRELRESFPARLALNEGDLDPFADFAAHLLNTTGCRTRVSPASELASEDLIGASEIIANLPGLALKGYIRPVFSSDHTRDFMESAFGKNLVEQGRRDDVMFCSRDDTHATVPILRDGVLVFL